MTIEDATPFLTPSLSRASAYVSQFCLTQIRFKGHDPFVVTDLSVKLQDDFHPDP